MPCTQLCQVFFKILHVSTFYYTVKESDPFSLQMTLLLGHGNFHNPFDHIFNRMKYPAASSGVSKLADNFYSNIESCCTSKGLFPC